MKRLPAEAIRDSMLLVADKLELDLRQGSEIAMQGDGPVRLMMEGNERPGMKGRMARARNFAAKDLPAYRSAFLGFPRNESYEIFDLFDAPDGSVVQGRRDTTNVPTQSLYLLNNTQVQQHCLDAAKSMLAKVGKSASEESKLKFIFRVY